MKARIFCSAGARLVATALLLLFARSMVHAEPRLPSTFAALEPGEVAWVLDHPHLRIAALRDAGPYEFLDPDSGVTGIVNDVLSTAAIRVGLVPQIEMMTDEDRQRSLIRGSIDLAPAQGSDARFEYSRPWLRVNDVLVTRAGTAAKHPLDLQGRMVVALAGSPAAEMLHAQYPALRLLAVDSALEGLRMLRAGEAEAWAGDQFTAAWLVRRHGMSNLQIAGFLESGPRDLRFRVPRSKPVVLKLLNRGLATIAPEEMREILGRYVERDWLGRAPELVLQAHEREWIATHRYLRLGVSEHWAPFGFVDEQGEFRGIAADMSGELAGRLGMAMAPVQFSPTDSGLLEALQRGELDLVPLMSERGSWPGNVQLSSVWLTDPVVLVASVDTPPIGGLAELSGDNLAMLESRMMPRGPEQDHPDIVFHYRRTPAQVMDAVMHGEVRAALLNLSTVNRMLRQEPYQRLQIAAPTPYEYRFVMASRPDWPQLATLLERAMQSLDADARAALIDPWLQLRQPVEDDAPTVLLLSWLVLVLLVLLIASIVRLPRMRRLRSGFSAPGSRDEDRARQFADRLAWLQHCLRRRNADRGVHATQVDDAGAAFRELMRLEPVQQLFSSMCDVMGVVAAISDCEGNLLTTRSWKSRFGGLDEDQRLDLFGGRARLIETEVSGISLYRCADGAWACRAEMHQGKAVIGEVAVAGFHLEAPDLIWMCQRMEDEPSQVGLLRRMAEFPVLERGRLHQVMRFLRSYVLVLRSIASSLSLERGRRADLKQARAQLLAARSKDLNLLQEFEQLSREILSGLPDDPAVRRQAFEVAALLPDSYVYVQDTAGRYCHATGNYAALLGEEDAAALIGRQAADIFVDEDAERLVAVENRVLQSGESTTTTEPYAAADGAVQISFSRRQLRAMDGRIIGLLAVGSAVSEPALVEPRSGATATVAAAAPAEAAGVPELRPPGQPVTGERPVLTVVNPLSVQGEDAHPHSVAALLRRMRAQIAAEDIDALDTLLELQECSEDPGILKMLERVFDALDAFDFDAAQQAAALTSSGAQAS